MVGTYWGRQYLQKIFECHRIVPKIKTEGVEVKFWKFVDLHDEDRRFRLPEYYHTVDKSVGQYDKSSPWEMQFSSGLEFDPTGRMNPERPIIFFKFIDRSLQTVVVRQPLTAGALLETTAMHSEIETSAKAIAALPDGERQVEEAFWRRELEGYSFDKEYTIYTAPAHTVGYYAQIDDLKKRYELAARVAYLCLNLTPNLFERLTPPAIMWPWRDRIAALKARRNVAFAFAAICAHAGKLGQSDTTETWLQRGLAASRLPPEREILARARRAIAEQKPQEVHSKIGATEKYLLDIGEIIFDHRIGNCVVDLDRAVEEGMPLPPMFNEREELFLIQGSSFDMKKFDALAMYNAEWDLFKETRNFLTSCR